MLHLINMIVNFEEWDLVWSCSLFKNIYSSLHMSQSTPVRYDCGNSPLPQISKIHVFKSKLLVLWGYSFYTHIIYVFYASSKSSVDVVYIQRNSSFYEIHIYIVMSYSSVGLLLWIEI